MLPVFLQNLIIHHSWNAFVYNEENVALLRHIEESISGNFTPPPDKVLRFLELDVKALRVVILGQDPYPQPEVATGRAFEVNNVTSWLDKRINTSLKNILKLLCKNQLGLLEIPTISMVRESINSNFSILPPDRLFTSWEQQGVLLLNTAYTCKIGNTEVSNSHTELWEPFSLAVISYIVQENPVCKWFLWGKNAQKYAAIVDEAVKLKSNHPRLNDFKPGSFLFENHFLSTSEIIWTGIII
ncbi:MAG: uracil-DNA glycosylase [Ignavibacteria bacterium]|nr:uracil-DNA glycosylase [Ignavibacteria bacterium]